MQTTLTETQYTGPRLVEKHAVFPNIGEDKKKTSTLVRDFTILALKIQCTTFK